MNQIPTNTALLRQILVAFIRNEVLKTGLARVVVGLSGGVDSALSAMLAAEALEAKNVLGVLMPYKSSNPDSQAHAELVVQNSGIEPLLVEITPQIDGYFERFPDADARRRCNKGRLPGLRDEGHGAEALQPRPHRHPRGGPLLQPAPHLGGHRGLQGHRLRADTPNCAGPDYGTPTFPTVTCNNGPNGDMFMNYMDYVDDAAMFMFTAQQVLRMRATLEGPRIGLS